jgi:hypothetical protein
VFLRRQASVLTTTFSQASNKASSKASSNARRQASLFTTAALGARVSDVLKQARP